MPSCNAAVVVLQSGSIKSVTYMESSAREGEREKQAKHRLNNSVPVLDLGAKRQADRGHAEMEPDISKLVLQIELWCFSQYLLLGLPHPVRLLQTPMRPHGYLSKCILHFL